MGSSRDPHHGLQNAKTVSSSRAGITWGFAGRVAEFGEGTTPWDAFPNSGVLARKAQAFTELKVLG
jgi:hypothetical protein